MNNELHKEMLILLGMMRAIGYPLMWRDGEVGVNNGYYDLIQEIIDRYEAICYKVIGE